LTDSGSLTITSCIPLGQKVTVKISPSPFPHRFMNHVGTLAQRSVCTSGGIRGPGGSRRTPPALRASAVRAAGLGAVCAVLAISLHPILPRVAPRFDLQSHSTHSDGELAPAGVVGAAALAGVELLALTDHDTLAGVSEALAAGERHVVRVVPAVELSAVDKDSPHPRELHILGYNIDHTSALLAEKLAAFFADRERRTLRMAGVLRELGFELDETEIRARVAADEAIGRPHLAEAVLACPANRPRLEAEKIDDLGRFIRAYLAEGRPAFRIREAPTVPQAILAIHEAGGLAVWAHPFWDISDLDEALARLDAFNALGIDGVEAFYLTHTREQTELLAERCAALGLLTTGSSDFHGPENSLFSRFLAFDTYGLEPNPGPIASAG
jgi:predicted metal-dependent phosphoesterase TrpH